MATTILLIIGEQLAQHLKTNCSSALLGKMSKQLSFVGWDFLESWTTSVLTSLQREFPSFEFSARGLVGKEMLFVRGRRELTPLLGWSNSGVQIDPKEIPKQGPVGPIVALDSSCIPVAELEDGSLYASRACVVFFNKSVGKRQIRFGPFLHHVTESTKPKAPSLYRPETRLAMDSNIVQHMIRVQLERGIAAKLLPMTRRSVLLLDGCLRTSLFESEESCLSKILSEARGGEVAVVGISKTTKVRILALASGALLAADSEAAYCDVHFLVEGFLNGLLGRVFLVRFTRNGMVFRVDVARESADEAGRVFSRILASDTFYNGYPDSLRVAHRLSVFTSTEVSALRAFLTAELNAKPLPSQDVRSIVLGSGLA